MVTDRSAVIVVAALLTVAVDAIHSAAVRAGTISWFDIAFSSPIVERNGLSAELVRNKNHALFPQRTPADLADRQPLPGRRAIGNRQKSRKELD
jgi:hypothetical protein